jgi:DNA/RNA endonuclease G (NUC1)
MSGFLRLSSTSLLCFYSQQCISFCEKIDGYPHGFHHGEQLIVPPVELDGKQHNQFIINYDKRTRSPKFVLELLIKSDSVCSGDVEALAKSKKRKPFYSDPNIDSDLFKSFPKDYTNTVYDRGHMAPAANYVCSPNTRDATFTMANICPQVRLGILVSREFIN